MKYTVFVQAQDYIEVESDSRDEAHTTAQSLAQSLARQLEWSSEIVLERE